MTALDTLRHLFPKSKQWNLVYKRPFTWLIEGITPSLDAAQDNADGVWSELIPATTSFGTGTGLISWERQWALPSSSDLTEQERRDRLAATWQALGGQSPGYITDTLTAQGFPVFTHEWWVLNAAGYPAARDPRDYLLPEYGGTDSDGILIANIIRTTFPGGQIGAGEPFAQSGEPRALSGYFAAYETELVAYSYVGPESVHPYYLYIGGETFPDVVSIPVERKDEFEALCRKICPAHLWLVLRVEYV
jgi:uncharacterized protein YmfQ (DUF2313 family)